MEETVRLPEALLRTDAVQRIHRQLRAATFASAISLLCIGECEANGDGTLLQWSSSESTESGPQSAEPLTTDRPDFTESSVTVGRGIVQIESGYTYAYNADSTTSLKSHSLPECLLRVGVLAEWMELRLFSNHLAEGENATGVGRSFANGMDDLGLGAKFAMTGQAGVLPEVAIVPQMRIPTGASGISARRVLPGVNCIYGWDVTEQLSAGGQTQLNLQVDDGTGRPYSEFSQSFTTGYHWTENLGTYLEWFVLSPAGAASNHTQNYLDGGGTYLLSNNLQIDIRAGVGLNEAADDLFTGVGISIRL